MRQRQEEFERIWLSPYGTKSADSRGREQPLAPCRLRTEFQRDRDRILHCKSFRRLKHKTQCFVAPEGDHYRTRLTHTLEVSQIARTISRALGLNEDLTEAIALGHDLGHTPFGHMGERTLDRLNPEGFRHNEHSLRVVSVLENNGMNLTWEVRDGIVHHTGATLPATMEGQVIRFSDRIAYINHDIDDAIRAGLLREEDLPTGSANILGHCHGARIDTMVYDIVQNSQNKDRISMSEPVQEATDALRNFLFENLYRTPRTIAQEKQADLLLTELYEGYLKEPERLPLDARQRLEKESLHRVICDYIAGMTDKYAQDLWQQWN